MVYIWFCCSNRFKRKPLKIFLKRYLNKVVAETRQQMIAKAEQTVDCVTRLTSAVVPEYVHSDQVWDVTVL